MTTVNIIFNSYHRHVESSSLPTITHVDRSHDVGAFTGVCLFVCLSVFSSVGLIFSHDVSKPDAAKITKLNIHCVLKICSPFWFLIIQSKINQF